MEAEVNERKYIFTRTYMSYEDAVEYCIRNDAILAPIKTTDDLESICNSVSWIVKDSVAVGMYYTDGYVVWSDGTPYDPERHLNLDYGRGGTCDYDCDVWIVCGNNVVYRSPRGRWFYIPFCLANTETNSFFSTTTVSSAEPTTMSGVELTTKQQATTQISTTSKVWPSRERTTKENTTYMGNTNEVPLQNNLAFTAFSVGSSILVIALVALLVFLICRRSRLRKAYQSDEEIQVQEDTEIRRNLATRQLPAIIPQQLTSVPDNVSVHQYLSIKSTNSSNKSDDIPELKNVIVQFVDAPTSTDTHNQTNDAREGQGEEGGYIEINNTYFDASSSNIIQTERSQLVSNPTTQLDLTRHSVTSPPSIPKRRLTTHLSK